MLPVAEDIVVSSFDLIGPRVTVELDYSALSRTSIILQQLHYSVIQVIIISTNLITNSNFGQWQNYLNAKTHVSFIQICVRSAKSPGYFCLLFVGKGAYLNGKKLLKTSGIEELGKAMIFMELSAGAHEQKRQIALDNVAAFMEKAHAIRCPGHYHFYSH